MVILGEMSNGLAHELNTPIAVILARAEMLEIKLKKNFELTPQTLLESIEIIIKASNRISFIIKGLKQFTRNDVHDPLTKNLVSSIVHDTLIFCESKFKSSNINLNIFLPENETEINCRPSQISQVLLNLLNNAYDAIKELDDKWINLEVKTNDGFCIISVKDSGPGIPPHVREKLMQPFFTTKEIGKGTGLGLSTSKGILESHHGSFYLASDTTNTTFVMKIPLSNTKTI